MTNTNLKVDFNKSKDEPKADSGATITAQELADLRKAANEVAELKKAKEASDAKAEAAEAEVAEFKKAAEKKAEEEMTELVKSFTFVGEEDQAETVAVLMKARSIEGAGVILATLNKAQKAIEEFATQEHGSDKTVDVEKTAAEQANADFDEIAAEIMKEKKEQRKGA